eukprot:760845-Hanusia_phi.AAC.2
MQVQVDLVFKKMCLQMLKVSARGCELSRDTSASASTRTLPNAWKVCLECSRSNGVWSWRSLEVFSYQAVGPINFQFVLHELQEEVAIPAQVSDADGAAAASVCCTVNHDGESENAVLEDDFCGIVESSSDVFVLLVFEGHPRVVELRLEVVLTLSSHI